MRLISRCLLRCTRPDIPWVSSYKLIVSYSRADYKPMIFLDAKERIPRPFRYRRYLNIRPLQQLFVVVKRPTSLYKLTD